MATSFVFRGFLEHFFSSEKICFRQKKYPSAHPQDKNELQKILRSRLEFFGWTIVQFLAVKKQARVFKSVLKLDKNFHIYIHGNRDLIEQGTDERGRKYYNIYYEEEQ